jgi:hypothetical protein
MKNLTKTFFLVLTILSFSYLTAGQASRVATIQGQLLRSDGRPLAYTEIELVPTGSEHIINDSRLIGVSSLNGKFSFFDVPPGSYTLSINFDDKPTALSPYDTYFYPGTNSRTDAEVLQITNSTRIRGLQFKLVSALVGKRITGTVTWEDGSPAREAMIGCRDLEYDRAFSFPCTRTDANGRFSAEGFVGRKYQIGAIVFDRPSIDAPQAPVSIIAGGESGIFDLEPSTPSLTIRIFRSKALKTVADKYLG